MSTITHDVKTAADVLRRGGVVAIPTETVYGLAARADNEYAIHRVFDIKGRPRHHPLIVHVASIDAAHEYGIFNDAAFALANVLWPGPLTLIVPRRPEVSDEITGGRDTVALRVPSHPLTLSLLELLGTAVVAPSANRFGMVSPTNAQHVAHDLGSDVDVILDGGTCDIGVESTIVDCSTSPVQILRPGAISENNIEAVLHEAPAPTTGPSRAPGMLASHYAPHCAVEMFETLSDAVSRQRQLSESGMSTRIIDRSHDAIQCARHLYADLRECDDAGLNVALFVLPEPSGIGRAVRDRLTKAAAPRPK